MSSPFEKCSYNIDSLADAGFPTLLNTLEFYTIHRVTLAVVRRPPILYLNFSKDSI